MNTTSSTKVLIVDDDPEVLGVLKDILEPEVQSIIDTACTVEEASNLLASNRYALAIIDIKMPIATGIDLFTKQIPILGYWLPAVIFVSGYHDEMWNAQMEALKSMGLLVEFLQKPVDRKTLIAKVITYIQVFAYKKITEDLVDRVGRIENKLNGK